MTRQFKIQDDDWGEYTLFVIHKKFDEEGNIVWEDRWDCFRTDPELQHIGDLFTEVSYDAYQDALRNHGFRLIQELGPPPEACFLKTNDTALLCVHRDNCAMHDPDECLGNKEPPVCFEANATTTEPDHNKNTLTTQIFDMWRNGFYVIIAPSERNKET